MRREQIIRDDFPTSRKGWDRKAVTEHLEAVAEVVESLEQATTPAPGESLVAGSKLSTAAGEQIGRVIAAGEELAAEIERSAREEAEKLLASARGEAESIRAAANGEADATRAAAEEEADSMRAAVESDAEGEKDRVRSESDSVVGAMQEMVARTIDDAERLRGRVSDLATQLGLDETDRAQTRVADSPSPVDQPSGGAEAAAEPQSAADSESAADDEPEPVLEAAVEPADEPDADSASDSDGASGSASDQEAAARLVAMNLALEGADAEKIKTDLAAEFDSIDDLDALVADVLARSGR